MADSKTAMVYSLLGSCSKTCVGTQHEKRK